MNNQSEVPLKVALYLRVSTEDQVEKYGLDLQKDALLSLIKSKGKIDKDKDSLILAGANYIYTDEGISGTVELDERPAFRKLKEDILFAPEGQRPFDIVAVYRIDRFARKLKILLNVIDFFEAHNIQFISATESIDTSTPFGKAILSIIGVIAELEIETIKERMRGGREQAVIRGVYMGANLPYGYIKNKDQEPQVFEEEAKTVREIFDLFVYQKIRPQQIALQLTKLLILTPQPSAIINHKRKGRIIKKEPIYFWRATKVKDILSNELYTGKYYSNKTKDNKLLPKDQWKLSPYSYPTIIDVVTFYKAQKLLRKLRMLFPPRKETYTYLLSGLLKCDHCKTEQNGETSLITWNGERKKISEGKYTYFYKCGRKNITKSATVCNVLPLPANEIEQYIVNYIRKLLDNPKAVYNHQKKLQSTRIDLNRLELKKKEFQKLLVKIPIQRKRLREQHKLEIIDGSLLQKEYLELDKEEKRLNDELSLVEVRINQNILYQGYEQSLQQFGVNYKEALKDIFTNRKEVYDIIHSVIEDIIVYSRPLSESDVIAGRRKSSQFIPSELEIKLRLPQDILNELKPPYYGSPIDFGVKNPFL